MTAGTGPLAGVRVLELAGLGPGPFAGMLLGDLGADVLVVDRVGAESIVGLGALGRGKRSVGVDLRAPEGVEVLLRLVEEADVLVDVYRPGVAERLGFGPEVCHSRNERLVYGRLTGFGQEGPLASRAGHDLGYLASSGALDPLGRAGGPPTAPINVLADFAGGGELLVVGVLAALVERATSGKGQVIDAAMVDGVSILAQMMWTINATGRLRNERESFMLDGGAPFYRTYETSDGGYVAVGSIEPQFFAALLTGLGLSPGEVPAQGDVGRYDEMRAIFTERFAARTRDHWTEVFAGTDACVTPVLTWTEAAASPHLRQRATLIEPGGVTQAAPAPRFSRTPAGPVGTPPTGTTTLDEIGW